MLIASLFIAQKDDLLKEVLMFMKDCDIEDLLSICENLVKSLLFVRMLKTVTILAVRVYLINCQKI